LNRAQQAYHFEYGEFSTSLVALETGMPTETDRFALATIIVSDGAVQNSGMAKQQGLYSLVGLVWVIDSGEGELTTNRQFCRSIASAHEPEKPIFPRWIRAMFRSQRGVAIYPAETPPAFELPELPARPDVVISCPDGYETER
ncbi:MAG: type IV pilin-like G/H family protein, partial [Cyanobacteria bacterium J06632_22]